MPDTNPFADLFGPPLSVPGEAPPVPQTPSPFGDLYANEPAEQPLEAPFNHTEETNVKAQAPVATFIEDRAIQVSEKLLPGPADIGPAPDGVGTLHTMEIQSRAAKRGTAIAPTPRTLRAAAGTDPDRKWILENPELAGRYRERSQRTSFVQLTEAGLIMDGRMSKLVTPEMLDELNGANLENAIVLYGPQSPRERHLAIISATTDLLNHGEQGIRAKLRGMDPRSREAAFVQGKLNRLIYTRQHVQSGHAEISANNEVMFMRAFERDTSLLAHGFAKDPNRNLAWLSAGGQGMAVRKDELQDLYSWMFDELDTPQAWKGVVRNAYEGALLRMRGKAYGIEDPGLHSAIKNSHPETFTRLALAREMQTAQGRPDGKMANIDTLVSVMETLDEGLSARDPNSQARLSSIPVAPENLTVTESIINAGYRNAAALLEPILEGSLDVRAASEWVGQVTGGGANILYDDPGEILDIAWSEGIAGEGTAALTLAERQTMFNPHGGIFGSLRVIIGASLSDIGTRGGVGGVRAEDLPTEGEFRGVWRFFTPGVLTDEQAAAERHRFIQKALPLDGLTPEFEQELIAQTAESQRMNGAYLSPTTWSHYIALAFTHTLRGLRDTVGAAWSHPEETGSILAVGGLIGGAGAVALQPMRAFALDFAATVARGQRIKSLVRVAVERSPESVQNVRRHIGKVAETLPPGRTKDLLVEAESNMRHLAARRGPSDLSTGGPSRGEAASRAKRAISQLQSIEADRHLSGLDLGPQAEALVNGTRSRDIVGTTIRAIGERLKIVGPAQYTGVFRKKTESLLAKIVEGIDVNDPTVVREARQAFLEGAPTAAEGAGLFERALELAKRSKNRVADPQAVNDLVENWTYLKEDAMMSYRDNVAQARGHSEDFLDTAAHRADMAGNTELARLLRNERDLRTEGASWDRNPKLSTMPELSEAVLPTRTILTRAADMDPEGMLGLYKKLRNKGEQFEAFEVRVFGTLWDADADPVKLTVLRKQLLEEFADPPPDASHITIDATGKALTRGEIENLRKKNVGLTDEDRARLLDNDIDYSTQVIDAKSDLADLRRIADADAVLDARGYLESSSGLAGVSSRHAFATTRHHTETLKANTILGDQELGALSTYMREHPEATKAYAEAIRLSDGDVSFEEIRRAHPEAFAGLPASQEQHVVQMMHVSRDFRRKYTDDLVEGGVMTPEQGDAFVRNYNGRAYKRTESILFGATTSPTRKADVPVGTRRGSDDLFEVQRDISEYRVIIGNDRQAPITANFKTHEEALTWIQKNYSLDPADVKAKKGSTRTLVEGEEFKPALHGDQDRVVPLRNSFNAEIVAPLGRQNHADLLPFQGQNSQLIGMQRAAMAAQRNLAFRSFDRPGWSAEPDDFALLPPEQIKDWTKEPLDGPQWGPLNGKHVKKAVKVQLDDFNDTASSLRSFMQQMDDEVRALSATGELAASAIKGAKFLGRKAKAAVIATIVRSGTTAMWNVVGDQVIFGNLATRGRLHTTAHGWRANAEAGKLVWDEVIRNKTAKATGRLHPEIREAVRLGVLDETYSGSGLPDSVRRDVLTMEYGADGSVTNPVKGGTKQVARNIFMPSEIDMVRANKLTKERDLMVASLTREQALPKAQRNVERIKNLQQNIQKFNDNLKAYGSTFAGSMARSLRMAEHALWQRKRGRFDEQQIATRELYAAASNHARLATWKMLRADGHTSEAAAKLVNEYMQTFSRVPRWIKSGAGAGLLNPVASFISESVRITKNAFMNRPGMLAAMTSAVPAWNFTMMAANGVDPYEAQAILGVADRTRSFGGAVMTNILWRNDNGWTATEFLPMNVQQHFRLPQGAIGAAAGALFGHDETLVESVWKAPLVGMLNLVAGAPLNYAVALATQINPKTGDLSVGGAGDWGWSAARDLLTMGMPSWGRPGGSGERFIYDDTNVTWRYSGRMRSKWERGLALVSIRQINGIGFTDMMGNLIGETKSRRRGGDPSDVGTTDPLKRELRAANARGDVEREDEIIEEIALRERIEKVMPGGNFIREFSDADKLNLIRSLNAGTSVQSGMDSLTFDEKASVLFDAGVQFTREESLEQYLSLVRLAKTSKERRFLLTSRPDRLQEQIDRYTTYLQNPTNPITAPAMAEILGRLQDQLPRAKYLEKMKFYRDSIMRAEMQRREAVTEAQKERQ